MSNLKEEILKDDNLMEKLADIEHQRWSDWQKYLHSKLKYYEEIDGFNVTSYYILPSDFFKHWEQQIYTPYYELSESEKESDREQVRRYLPLLESFLSSKLDEIEKEVMGLLPEDSEEAFKVGGSRDYSFYDEGYNSAIQTIREKLTKYFT